MKNKEFNPKRTGRNPVTDLIKTITYLKGLNYYDVADIIGFAHSTYSYRLRDGNFSILELIQICDACDLSIVIEGKGIRFDLKEYLEDSHIMKREVNANEDNND